MTEREVADITVTYEINGETKTRELEAATSEWRSGGWFNAERTDEHGDVQWHESFNEEYALSVDREMHHEHVATTATDGFETTEIEKLLTKALIFAVGLALGAMLTLAITQPAGQVSF